jgi:hypothetical protein
VAGIFRRDAVPRVAFLEKRLYISQIMVYAAKQLDLQNQHILPVIRTGKLIVKHD